MGVASCRRIVSYSPFIISSDYSAIYLCAFRVIIVVVGVVPLLLVFVNGDRGRAAAEDRHYSAPCNNSRDIPCFLAPSIVSVPRLCGSYTKPLLGISVYAGHEVYTWRKRQE